MSASAGLTIDNRRVDNNAGQVWVGHGLVQDEAADAGKKKSAQVIEYGRGGSSQTSIITHAIIQWSWKQTQRGCWGQNWTSEIVDN